jgi:hypothetical protein
MISGVCFPTLSKGELFHFSPMEIPSALCPPHAAGNSRLTVKKQLPALRPLRLCGEYFSLATLQVGMAEPPESKYNRRLVKSGGLPGMHELP